MMQPDIIQTILKDGHLIVGHDLNSHDGELPSGIAETFIECAKITGRDYDITRQNN